MKKTFCCAIKIALCLAIFAICSQVDAKDFKIRNIRADAKYSSNSILVKFEPDSKGKTLAKSQKANRINALGKAKIRDNFDMLNNWSVVELPEGVSVQQALEILEQTDGVAYAEPDYELEATYATYFNQQWALNNTGQSVQTQVQGVSVSGKADADIDCIEAWDSRPTAWVQASSIVAVIDTGVDYNHSDINMWRNTYEYNGIAGVDDDGNGIIDDIYGCDYHLTKDGGQVIVDGDPFDDNSHGTHCAGIIAGKGFGVNSPAGTSAAVMALKFLDSTGHGDTSAAIKCIEYAISKNANIINASWGGGNYSQALYEAINNAKYADILFVAAAGNDSIDLDSTDYYPACYSCDNIIVVAATDQNDELASFSNYGSEAVDIAAPGVNIWSTIPNNQYTPMNGTSMAAPLVSSVAAELLFYNSYYSYSSLKSKILRTVDVLTSLNGDIVNSGRLNFARATGVLIGIQNTNKGCGYDSLQAAIDDASAGDYILIDDGVYSGAGFQDIEFGGKDLTIKSINGRANCIFDPDLGHRAFYIHQGETTDLTIDGITVRDAIKNGPGAGIYVLNSSATITNCIFDNCMATSDHTGGGIMTNNSHVLIDDCIFYENHGYYGGALSIRYNSVATITNCIIDGGNDGTYVVNNSDGLGGGVLVSNDSIATISSCQIRNNEGNNGGGLCVSGLNTNVTIDNSYIQNNISRQRGAGFYVQNGANLSLTDCEVTGNYSKSDADYNGGAGLYFRDSGTTGTILRCLISGNSTHDHGGGIHSGEGISSMVITESTISNNSAADWGGGLYVLNNNVTVNNCIIDGNSAQKGGGIMNNSNADCLYNNSTIINNVSSVEGDQVYNSADSQPTFTGCAIEDGINGIGFGGPGVAVDGGGNTTL